MREGGNEDGDAEADADGRVLSADELDISEQEEVASLGEGRFVVGADGAPNTPDDAIEEPSIETSRPQPANNSEVEEETAEEEAAETEPEPEVASDPATESTAEPNAEPAPTADQSPDVSGRDVKSWLSDELTRHDSSYAYHIAAKADGDVANQQLATDDIGAAFDGLLVWYARQVATDTSVDEALGILLSESGVRVRYPTSRFVEYLDAKDLGPEDSISDLVAAISEDDGLVFTKGQ